MLHSFARLGFHCRFRPLPSPFRSGGRNQASKANGFLDDLFSPFVQTYFWKAQTAIILAFLRSSFSFLYARYAVDECGFFINPVFKTWFYHYHLIFVHHHHTSAHNSPTVMAENDSFLFSPSTRRLIRCRWRVGQVDAGTRSAARLDNYSFTIKWFVIMLHWNHIRLSAIIVATIGISLLKGNQMGIRYHSSYWY